MKKWEYKTMMNLVDWQLKEQGEDGWELAGTANRYGHVDFYFKREIE